MSSGAKLSAVAPVTTFNMSALRKTPDANDGSQLMIT